MHQDFDDELTRRLEAYAEARLSPGLSATSRMRAHVMAAAHRQAVLTRADADRGIAAAAPSANADRTRRSTWRRPMTVLLAAGLTLAVSVGSVAAAQPGGPLYDVRVWGETLTLPADPNARAQAELNRLADRLAEAAAAVAAGDTNAANAALRAYEAIVAAAAQAASGNPAAGATVEQGVRNNIEVLEALATRVPEQAQDAIRHAIDRSDSELDKVRTNPAGNPSNGLGPDGNPGDPGGPNATDAARSPNPNKPTDDPAATPKPRPTPKPKPTPAANETSKPTPRGGPPSERPAGGPPSDQQGGGNPND